MPGAQLVALPALQQVQYDPVRDFAPVATLLDLLNFIAVPPGSPADTIPQLIDYGKRKADGLTVGAAGFGSPAHFNSVILSLDTGNSFEGVLYRADGTAFELRQARMLVPGRDPVELRGGEIVVPTRRVEFVQMTDAILP